MFAWSHLLGFGFNPASICSHLDRRHLKLFGNQYLYSCIWIVSGSHLKQCKHSMYILHLLYFSSKVFITKMERGFLWIVLMFKITITIATNSLSTVTSSSTSSSSTQTSVQSPSTAPLGSSSNSSSTPLSPNSTSTADSGGSSINSASSAVSASSTMQQKATVSSDYTTTTTSSDNTPRGANTGSTVAIQTVNSSNPQTSQSRSTYSQNVPLSPSGKLLRRAFLWGPFFDLWNRRRSQNIEPCSLSCDHLRWLASVKEVSDKARYRQSTPSVKTQKLC